LILGLFSGFLSVLPPGGGPFIVLGWLSWRRAASGSIPGVGVAPGFLGLLAFFGSIPGIGPFATTFAFFGSGIPGVEFPDGGTGLVDIPGGNSLGPAFATFAFADAFEFCGSTEPQPILSKKAKQVKTRNRNFVIEFKKTSSI
jgi:hypothetical protein